MKDIDPEQNRFHSRVDTLRALLRVAANTGGANITRNPDFADSPELDAIEEARMRAAHDSTNVSTSQLTKIDEL